MFIKSGFADECAKEFALQIKMHKLLKWDYIDIRLVDGIQIDNLPERKFDEITKLLSDNNIKVSSLGSAIGKKEISQSSIADDMRSLERLCKYANILNCKYIRINAYKHGQQQLSEWWDKAIDQLKKMGSTAEEYGIVLVLENCTGYPSISGKNMREMLELIDLNNIQCAFDIGNAVYYGSNAWDYYSEIKNITTYIHLKDTCYDKKQAFPGEGDSQITRILKDLHNNNYNGFVSIEPHVASSEHLPENKSHLNRWDSYYNYGLMANSIMDEISKS